jgi:signal transduction histidine kinase
MVPSHVELKLSADPATPEALVDPAQLHQIVMNLAINACQAFEATQKGHIEVVSSGVHLDGAEVDALRLPRPGHYALVEVRDDGKGIDADVLPHIFEPFFTTKAPGVGTGLGLSVVQGILRDHGGAITVRSKPAKGTTFSLYLPAAPDTSS